MCGLYTVTIFETLKPINQLSFKEKVSCIDDLNEERKDQYENNIWSVLIL